VKHFTVLAGWLFLLLFLPALSIIAQIDTDIFRELQQTKPGQGRLHIVQRQNIAYMVNSHIVNAHKRNWIYGYRIRIYSDSGPQARKKGEETLAQFIGRFDEVESYFTFDYPFYRVYVGDFRSQSEALRFLKKVEPYYPNAFMVRTKINYPAL
jgi:hypothetical protein